MLRPIQLPPFLENIVPASLIPLSTKNTTEDRQEYILSQSLQHQNKIDYPNEITLHFTVDNTNIQILYIS